MNTVGDILMGGLSIMIIRIVCKFLCIPVLAGLFLFTGTAWAQPATMTSIWTATAPDIDGFARAVEWEQAAAHKHELNAGWILVQNDARFLYLLIDVTQDTGNDPPLQASPWGDYFSLSFDVDGKRTITPEVDVAYALYPGSHRIGKQYFRGPGRYTGLQATEALIGTRFTRSYQSHTPHRIWEIAIPLTEIDAQPGGIVRFGVTLHSVNPAFHYEIPRNYPRDFRRLLSIQLAKAPFALMTVQPGVLAQHTAPPAGATKRTILPDGSVELQYPDGSKKRLFDGGMEITAPDGTKQTLLFLQAQPDTPPNLPGEPIITQWMNGHAESLLEMIRKLVGNNDQAIAHYLQREADEPRTLYQKIQLRMICIDRLTSE